MCKDATQYQKELIKNTMAILSDCLAELENGTLSNPSVDSLEGMVLSQIQDVVDIARAPDDVKRTEIMYRWT
jgi:C4-type Zn-finger protein